jgi:hypothetical protein
VTDRPPLPPEVLERMRQIGLRIDGRGRLWHQDEEVTHAGLRRAIMRWLDVKDDGRVVVRLDDVRYAYVDVDDTPLRVVAIRWDGAQPVAILDDGTTEPLAMATLVADPDDRLRCRVRGDRLTARLTSAAQQVLLERATVGPGGYGIAAGGQFWPLAPLDAP